MIRVGTAGWNIPRASAAAFAGEGRHLQRYSAVMDLAEINSSFHRPHRVTTYMRWADETPPGFRFAVKLPRTITHTARLVGTGDLFRAFLDQVHGLGPKLGVLLVQMPPSLAFVASEAESFFAMMRGLYAGAVVCEPRHATWFEPDAEQLLRDLRIGRVAADPALAARAAEPGGWLGPADDGIGATVYHRWHGAPRVYWSRYDADWLVARAIALNRWPPEVDRWCIFDNTAAGAALENACSLQAALSRCPAPIRGSTAVRPIREPLRSPEPCSATRSGSGARRSDGRS